MGAGPLTPDFRSLWAAQAVSAVGARIAREGLPMAAVLALGGGPGALGLLAALMLGAGAAAAVAGAPFVDRLPRRPLMIAADIGRSLALAAVAAAALAHRLDLTGLCVAAVVVSALGVMFDAADHAILPALVSREQLTAANARLGAVDAAAEMAGPALGGGLFSLVAPPIALAVTAVTYLVSAAFLGAIRARPARLGTRAPFDLDFTAGFRACLGHALVRPLLLASLGSGFFGAFFAALYVLFSLTVLSLSPAMLGLTIAAGGLGALAGAAAAPWAARVLGPGPAIVATRLAGGLAALLVPLAGGSPSAAMAVLVLSQLVGDALNTIGLIGATSLRQAVLPPSLLGRTSSAFLAGQGLAGTLGALAAGALAARVGVRETLYIAAAGVTVSSLITLASPLRALRETPEAETLEAQTLEAKP